MEWSRRNNNKKLIKLSIIFLFIIFLLYLGTYSFLSNLNSLIYTKESSKINKESILEIENLFNLKFPEDTIFEKYLYRSGQEIQFFLTVKYNHLKFIDYLENNPKFNYIKVDKISYYTEYQYTNVTYSNSHEVYCYFTKDKNGNEYLEFVASDTDLDFSKFLKIV